MPLTNEKFIEFIEKFSKNKKYYDSVREISKSKSYPFDPLIRNDFPMYSLDDICKDSPAFS